MTNIKIKLPALSLKSTIFIISTFWVAMVLWNFGLPGLHIDEINHFAFIPGILTEQSAQLHHFRLADNIIDQKDGIWRFPILGGSIYNSVIGAYLGLPFFKFVGFSVESVRLFSGFLGLASILTLTIVVGRVFGWLAALMMGLVIVSDPTSSFSLRSQGIYFWYVILFAALCSHVLFEASRRRFPSHLMAAAAGTLIGLLVASYFVGLFVALPLVILSIWIFRRRPSTIITFTGAGLIAYSPVLYALTSIYIQTPSALSNFGIPQFAVKSSFSVFSWFNFERFLGLLDGAIGRFTFSRGIVGNFSTPFSEIRWIAIGVGVVSAVIVWMRVICVKRSFFLCTIAISLVYLASMFFLKGVNLHHVIPFTVLLFLIISSAASAPSNFRYIATGVMVVLFTTNLVSLAMAHQSLARTGGINYHNEAYSVPAYLFRTSLKDYHPLFVSWGLHLQFLFQTEGSVAYSFIGTPSKEKISTAVERFGKVAVIVNQNDLPIDEIIPVKVRQTLLFSQRDGKGLFNILLIER